MTDRPHQTFDTRLTRPDHPSSRLAIALLLAVLYGPAIVSLMLAEPIRGTLQRLSPTMSGLAVQRTVERADSVPIGQLAGLAVAVAWALVAVLVAVLLVRRRGA